MATRPTLRCGDRAFALGSRTFVMGIVNITPDSFSDGGRFMSAGGAEDIDVDAAVTHAEALFAAGADVVDLGGESTRPGAAPVAVEVEQARVLPVVRALVARGHRALSVDTRHARTARAALDAGAAWVNDVSGLADPDMADAARAADALVVMHWQHALQAGSVGDAVDDDDIVGTVTAFLRERVGRALAAGIDGDRVLVDPGIGFGKTVAHNLALSRDLADLARRCGVAGVLYGPSRKRFLGAITGRATPEARDAATIGAVCAGIASGVDVVRVHDVDAVIDAVRVADAILRPAVIPAAILM